MSIISGIFYHIILIFYTLLLKRNSFIFFALDELRSFLQHYRTHLVLFLHEVEQFHLLMYIGIYGIFFYIFYSVKIELDVKH